MRFSQRAIVLTSSALALVAGAATGCGGGTDEGPITQTTTTAAATTTTARTATEPGDVQAMSGARLFTTNCQSCHGPHGADGPVGPNLQKSSVAGNLAQVMQQIRNGGGAMPPFSDVLSDEEIDVVARYVVEQIAPSQ